MKRGITIGKFYPPHKGHKYLIEQALAQVDQLTVIVCHHQVQKISGELRAKWLKEMVPAIDILVLDDCLADDDSKGWAEYTIQSLGYVPDVVFTSEDYGHAYAEYMGTEHVLVDRERNNVPIMAKQVRRDPYQYWEYLEPCVRVFFTKKICIVGAESSGTTTLAKALAEHYHTVWVPEFGHEYSSAKLIAGTDGSWTTDEFIFIADRQNRIEDESIHKSNKILICDTDSFSTSIWHERYVGHILPEVAKISDGRHYDLYLLTDVDIPFVQDGTRDGEQIRHWMHKRFIEELEKRNKMYELLSGNHVSRLNTAIKLCDSILNKQPDL